MYSIGEIRPGMAVLLDGTPFLVLRAQHKKQARGAGICKTSIKNLLTGATINKTFQGSEKIEPADMSISKAQYLYQTDGECHFMDNKSFVQFSFSSEDLGDQALFLSDGMEVEIKNFNDQPIGIKLPPKVILEVMETEPGVKGDTASGGTKPAKTTNGLVVNVPFFMNIGDKIRVNTDTKEYVERV